MNRTAEDGNHPCPSRLELAGYQAGETSGRRAAALARHLERCPACRSELQALERRQGEFLAAHPPGVVLAEVGRRAEARPHRPVLHLVTAGLAAGLAALLLLWAWPHQVPRETTVRTKGGFSLQVYLLRRGRVTPAEPGTLFLPGDRIQFTCTSPAGGYLFLASVDARSRVFNFNNQGSEKSVRVAAGSNRVVEGSIMLDDSPLPERVFAILSPRPLDFDQVRRAVQRTLNRAGGNASPENMTRIDLPYPQASFLLRKRRADEDR